MVNVKLSTARSLLYYKFLRRENDDYWQSVYVCDSGRTSCRVE